MLTKHFFPLFDDLALKDDAPLVVAFSGGGDSTALLYLLIKWAHARKKAKVTALIVDHGLREGSEIEASLAAENARQMGARAEVLMWVGEKPVSAIQETARKARYKLLGEACRRLGAGQLFLGHNQDDQAETIYMRIQKQSGWRGMAGMGLSKMSPLWPELYGVEIVRPLLGVSREELRGFNREQNLSYIEDPSNEDNKFTRIRIREKLAEMPEIKEQLLRVGMSAYDRLQDEIHTVCLFIFRSTHFLTWGGVRLNINNIVVSPEIIVAEALKYLILAVSGGNHVPTQEQRQNLIKKITSDNFKGATLGGVQFIPDDETILLVRDPGDVMGRHKKPAQAKLKLLPKTPVIWDGRFKIKTCIKGASIAPLMAHIEKLSKTQKSKLKKIPISGRASLLCLLSKAGIFIPYVDAPNEDFTVQCLVKERLCGMGVLREDA